jgi:hypothetical protein
MILRLSCHGCQSGPTFHIQLAEARNLFGQRTCPLPLSPSPVRFERWNIMGMVNDLALALHDCVTLPCTLVCPRCEPVQMSSQNLAQQLALAPSRPPLNFKTTRIPLSGLDFCRVSHSGAPVPVLQISTCAVSGIINDLRKKNP